MTRKYLRERQARKIAEGQQDHLNRCGFCKRALPKAWTCRLADGQRFCNADCEADDKERTVLMEARK